MPCRVGRKTACGASSYERAHLVARRRHHAALSRPSTNDDGVADEPRLEHPLDRHEKRVEVQTADARRGESHDARSLYYTNVQYPVAPHSQGKRR
jgi:hypothetical protein